LSETIVPAKKRGRPSYIDWPELFADWLKSGQSIRDFLLSRGLDPTSGNARRKTAGWMSQAIAASVGVHSSIFETAKANDNKAQIKRLIKEKKTKIVAVENTVSLPDGVLPEEPIVPAGEAKAIVSNSRPIDIVAAYEQINAWRQRQALDDWRSADALRTAIKIIIREKILKKEGQVNTVLKAVEIRQLAQALCDIQRVQRLALGMSTDNVGIDRPDSNVEKPTISDEELIPTYVVEMSEGGKFVRPRPRRVV